jgi:predicted metalloprotease with PDZ domain
MAAHPFAGWHADSKGAGALTLRRVDRDGPAQRAGLQVGDELLALDGQRVRRDDDLAPLLGDPTAPEPLPVLFCRDGRVRSVSLQPDPPVVVRWRLETLVTADAASLERRQRWQELRP